MRDTQHGTDETPDFVVNNVLELADYSDHGVAVTVLDADGGASVSTSGSIWVSFYASE